MKLEPQSLETIINLNENTKSKPKKKVRGHNNGANYISEDTFVIQIKTFFDNKKMDIISNSHNPPNVMKNVRGVHLEARPKSPEA